MAEKLSFFLSEWQACDPDGFAAREANPETVLETISRVRLNDVKEASAALPLEALKAKVEAEAAPAVDFYERLKRVDGMAVLAEIKRASPSKALIAPDIVAEEQGLRYANAGAAAISVRKPSLSLTLARVPLPSARAPPAGAVRAALVQGDAGRSRRRPRGGRAAGRRAAGAAAQRLPAGRVPAVGGAAARGGHGAADRGHPGRRAADGADGGVARPRDGAAGGGRQRAGDEAGAGAECADHRDQQPKPARFHGGHGQQHHPHRGLGCVLAPLPLTLVAAARAERPVLWLCTDMAGETIFLALSGITGPESVSPYRKAGLHGVLVGEALMRAEDPGAAIDGLRTAPAI